MKKIYPQMPETEFIQGIRKECFDGVYHLSVVLAEKWNENYTAFISLNTMRKEMEADIAAFVNEYFDNKLKDGNLSIEEVSRIKEEHIDLLVEFPDGYAYCNRRWIKMISNMRFIKGVEKLIWRGDYYLFVEVRDVSTRRDYLEAVAYKVREEELDEKIAAYVDKLMNERPLMGDMNLERTNMKSMLVTAPPQIVHDDNYAIEGLRKLMNETNPNRIEWIL